MSDIEIDILPTGEIRFTGVDSETNDYLMDMFSHLVENDLNADEKRREIARFFEQMKPIDKIVGKELLCG